MTTHFTSGTNVVTGGTGEKLKQPDPIKYHVYHEDFDKYTASDGLSLQLKLVAETHFKL